ncbi:MAG: ABC transporter permease, partial [Thermomicrobiaceae bacterium]|nr:ABC transporter permease [Thermomicrobiaceae bacterium]
MSFDSFVGASSASASRLPRALSGPERLWVYLRDAAVVAEIEIRKLRHDPTELFTRAVQPVLWLVIFGKAFSRVRAIPTGQVDYLTFMTPGILAQSLMFISIFYGLTIIWDRDQGILQKLLVMP